MGDVIHALPVVSDLVRAMPDVRIDWVVEESFADLPRLHPRVDRVLPVAVRRWRHSPFSAATRADVRRARAAIGAHPYDLVIDLQGLVKSAWIATWARGPRVGFSFRCVRDPLAAVFYGRRFDVDLTAHAIERMRQLAAAACGYRVEGLPGFGLAPAGATPAGVPAQPYAVLLHATSRAEKRWPLEDWRVLSSALAGQGLRLALPWGSADERRQAEDIAAGQPAATVLPRLSLAECAILLRDAQCVVGIDTGLTHLAAALERPTVALFAATPAWRYGPYWSPRARSLGDAGVWPSPQQVLQTLQALQPTAAMPAAAPGGGWRPPDGPSPPPQAAQAN